MEDNDQELHNSVGPALNINAKIKDYEEKYPFVLINGTKSIYNKLKLIDSNITTNYDNYNEYNNYDNTNNNDNYDNYDDYDDYEDTQQESNNKWTFDRGVADQPTA